MVKNRFEQVSEVQPDAITLVLKRDNDGASGSIVFPATASGGRRCTDQISSNLPAQDAYRGAIRLANDMKVAIVVCDPDGVWKSEWGELFQARAWPPPGQHGLRRGMEASIGRRPSPRPSFSLRALIPAILVAVGCPAQANDSAAELSIGGLQFVRTNDVAMESEDLRIG